MSPSYDNEFDLDAILREYEESIRPLTGAPETTVAVAEPEPDTPQIPAAPESAPRTPARPARPAGPAGPAPAQRDAAVKPRAQRETPPAPTPKTAAGKDPRPSPLVRVLMLPIVILALLSLAWMILHLHPDSSTAIAAVNDTRLDLVNKIDIFMNNAASDALEDIVYIRKIYTIPESALVAPKPDPNKFGVTDDPAVIQAVVDSAAELLDGQELAWNPEIERMPNSTMRYYCDDTILVITWKEVLNNSAVTFAEIKIADGSQLRRALAGGSYGSSVREYATDMAEEANAVIAINGDFYDYRTLGITVYQRQLYRNNPRSVDSCFFTASGDMLMTHMGELSGEGEAERFIRDNDVVFAVAFGPILVENGELQQTYSYPIGEINNIYSRAVIAQKDELHYILMTIGEEQSFASRCNINTAAQYIYDKGVINAYTLDGGQTATIAMQGSTVNRVDRDEERTMSDIIYFATAVPGEEARP